MQLQFTIDCPTRTTGDYASRFTLAAPGIGHNKVAVRPKYVHRWALTFALLEIDCTCYQEHIISSSSFASLWSWNMCKPIRPSPKSGKLWITSICSMHVHGVLEMSPEYTAEHGNQDWTVMAPAFHLNTSYLKHIRPSPWIDENGKAHKTPCAFGRQTDPDGENVLIIDWLFIAKISNQDHFRLKGCTAAQFCDIAVMQISARSEGILCCNERFKVAAAFSFPAAGSTTYQKFMT